MRSTGQLKSTPKVAVVLPPHDQSSEARRALGIAIPTGRPTKSGNCSLPTQREILDRTARMTGPGVYFATIEGDCMAPEFCDGWTVEFHADIQPRDGDFVHVVLNGVQQLKRYRDGGACIILETMNPDYPDLVVKPTNRLAILGVARAIVDIDLLASDRANEEFAQRALARAQQHSRLSDWVAPLRSKRIGGASC